VRRSNADTVIVFVHGIFGDSSSTWTNFETGAYWPELIAQDRGFTGADIYVLSFTSTLFDGGSTIDEIVEQANSTFAADEIFSKHKHVVLLCHSMGGLVVRGLLRRYRPLVPKVPMVYFYATPTNGAEISRLAGAITTSKSKSLFGFGFSANPQIRGLVPAEADSYPMILMRDWQAANLPIISRCAYEEKKTFGVQIVTSASASALCSSPALPIDRDHLGIVKPTGPEDAIYKSFKEAYLTTIHSWAASTTESESSDQPDSMGRLAALIVPTQLDVSCGKVREDVLSFSLPSSKRNEERWVDSVASLQQTENLKDRLVTITDHTDTTIKIRYKLVGLDSQPNGSCTADGKATLIVAFLITHTPRNGSGGATARIYQRTSGDFAPAIAGVSGNVTIIKGADAKGVLQALKSSSLAQPGMLSLATNSSLQGLLLKQNSRGELSPALAAIGGSVFILDASSPMIKPK